MAVDRWLGPAAKLTHATVMFALVRRLNDEPLDHIKLDRREKSDFELVRRPRRGNYGTLSLGLGVCSCYWLEA